jgi:DNA polymerase III gamma/tau subunit
VDILIEKLFNFSGSSICLVNQDNFILEKNISNIRNKINQNDILEIYPKDGNIKIVDIREMQEFLLYKPNFSKYKLVIIHEIDKMNIQAANSILKTLEEPPE